MGTMKRMLLGMLALFASTPKMNEPLADPIPFRNYRKGIYEGGGHSVPAPRFSPRNEYKKRKRKKRLENSARMVQYLKSA